MKKIFLIFTVLITIILLSACNDPDADYDSPNAVIEAHEAIHTEWENSQLFDDLKGKTFKLKTTQELNKSESYGNQEKVDTSKKQGYDWVCVPYSDFNIDVMLWLTNEQWENIKYNKGDTLLLKVDIIAQRGTKDGKIRQYYINAVMPD